MTPTASHARTFTLVHLVRPSTSNSNPPPFADPLERDRRVDSLQALGRVNIADVVLDSLPSRRQALRSLEALNVGFSGILNGIDCDSLEPLDDESLGVPVFDEYVDGVAVVACAAAVRGLQIAGVALHDAQIVVTGSGRSSVACAELLCALDIDGSQILMVDDEGVLHAERRQLPEPARQFAVRTSSRTLADAVAGADVVVGLSTTVPLTPELVPLMAARPALLAFSRSELRSSVAVHFPAHVLRACDDPTCVHQATDLLALPGIIRGSLDVDAAFVDDEMRVAAVRAMVTLAPGTPIARRRSARRSSPPLVPSLVDPRLVPAVASSVAGAAVASGAARARGPFDPRVYASRLREC